MHHFGSDAELQSFRIDVATAAARQFANADASRAWRDLIEGRTSILDSFATPEWSYLVVTDSVRHAPVTNRGLDALERVLSGSCPKRVASDFKVTQSTLAVVLKQTLARLGSDCLPSKVPFGLVALMYRARAAGPQPPVYTRSAQLLGVECEILTTPFASLAQLLSPAVEDVVRLHASGKTHREIAALRGKSPRTVANQLATAFHRIGASGRLSLVEFFLSHCDDREQSLQRTG